MLILRLLIELKISPYLNKKIILCYGDTLVDINLNKLINYFENIKINLLFLVMN